MLIAYFLPRMPDQPRWQPWIKYRGLNRIFKKAIEDYYIKHWIQQSVIAVDYNELDTPVFNKVPYPVSESFASTGYADPEERIAVFEGCFYEWSDPVGRHVLEELEGTLPEYTEKGYHPLIAVWMEDGITDMIPMDLRLLRSSSTRSYVTFEWRVYLSTLLDELRYTDEYEARHQCKTQVRLAVELDYKVMHDAMTHLEATQKLQQAAGTHRVGSDGRLLAIRRNRRYRMGIKSGQIPPEPNLHPIVETRFTRLDEEFVTRKLLRMAWNDDFSVDVEW